MRLSRSNPVGEERPRRELGPRRPDVERPDRARGRFRGAASPARGEERGAPAAAQLRPAAPSLILPSFSADIPRELEITSHSGAIADLAEAFLEAGVLGEDQWAGALDTSVQAGVIAWAHQGMTHDWEVFRGLALWYSDDWFSAVNYDDNGDFDRDDARATWCSVHGGDIGIPIGALAFEVTSHYQVTVGRRIKAIERRLPGAGFALINLVQIVLGRTVNCGGPGWCADEIETYADNFGDEEEQEEAGYLSLRKFYKRVPEEACCTKAIDIDLLRAAAGMRWRNGTGEVFRRAVALIDLWKVKEPKPNTLANVFADDEEQGPDWRDHAYNCLPVQQYLPIGVRWSGDDDIPALIDDYHEQMMQSGEGTDVVYLRGFQTVAPKDPRGTVEAAAAAMRMVLTTLDHCDVILDALDIPEDQYGKPLPPEPTVGPVEIRV